MSKAEVLDALDDAVPWQSTAVRRAAVKAKWGTRVSTRALVEYLFARVVLGHEPEVDLDEHQIAAETAAAVLAGLSPAQIATAVLAGLPADLARQVVDELAGRLQAAAATGTAI